MFIVRSGILLPNWRVLEKDTLFCYLSRTTKSPMYYTNLVKAAPVDVKTMTQITDQARFISVIIFQSILVNY